MEPLKRFTMKTNAVVEFVVVTQQPSFTHSYETSRKIFSASAHQNKNTNQKNTAVESENPTQSKIRLFPPRWLPFSSSSLQTRLVAPKKKR